MDDLTADIEKETHTHTHTHTRIHLHIHPHTHAYTCAVKKTQPHEEKKTDRQESDGED